MQTDTLDALAPYSELRANIEKLKAENAEISFDYTDPRGIKSARSHIYALRQRRADIERVRKAAKAEALDYGRKVDSAAKELTAEVDSMIEVHQKPIDEIEAREAKRKERHESNMAKLAMPEVVSGDSAGLQVIMDAIATTPIDESWEEYEAPARKLRDQTLQALSDLKVAAKQREDEQAELERLRKEQAEREQAEREAKIAAEAAAKAKREAEDAAMAEAKRKEAETQAAIEAERRRADAALQAERDKAAEIAREAAEAEAKRAAELARLEREAEAEKAAQAKREADEAHRQRVLKEIEDAMGKYDNLTGIVLAIADGKIPHVTVNF